jgi:mannose-6-phosphate isomerase-like protein (cupin superfamily)|tara:strand:- start:2274 stop:2957 length:684 start_codon:yes stop_codon:yes gene_type:complete
MKIDKYLINKNETIKSALKKIDGNHLGIIFIEDDNKVVGVATDGDIRRFMLKDNNLDSIIHECMNKDFFYLIDSDVTNDLILESLNDRINVIPVLNSKRSLVSVVSDKVTSWETTVHKPWGYYNTLISNKEFLVKKIVIFPKQSISLQIHNFRSEHWIVLEGTATILINKNEITLKKSESTYVPQKTEHKVTNNTDEPLIILETQLGTKLSENDIIRIEDQYNRKSK